MPDASKKSTGGVTNDTKAPVIGSPTKHKAGGTSPDKKASMNEAVKLPSITPTSPAKKSSKSEPSLTSLSNGAVSTVLTPTSPSRPPAKQLKAGGKASLTPMTKITTNARAHDPVVRRQEGLLDDYQTREADDCECFAQRTDDSPVEPVSTIAATLGGEAGSANADVPIQQQPVTDSNAQAETSAAVEAAVPEAVRAQEETEAARLRKENGNGTVKLIYEQYDELFPIVDGSTTQAVIDEVYCLSFVMPNCLVRLSHHPNTERFERENSGVFDSLIPEGPRGTYHTLMKDQTYYVVVEQEADQLRRDQEATHAKWAPAIQYDKLKHDDERGFESCSCIYGNPCVDEYGCRDWHSRFAVATANGWKGF